MAKNPYAVLGVPASASDSEIRAAFRKLAKQHHPDRNPGDKASEEKFKEVSSAFDILGDADQRKRYDRGEIDEQGRERAVHRPYTARPGAGPGMGGGMGGGGPYSQGTEGSAGAYGGASFEDLGDIFADLFGAGRRPGYGPGPSGMGPSGMGSGGFSGGSGMGGAGMGGARGRDLRYRLEIDFLDAVKGATKRVTMPDGKTLDITIPAGIEDGQTLRLKGQGEKAQLDRSGPGDVYVEIKVKRHALFERDGADIHIEAPITLKEAVLGGKITAPTIAGDVSLTVPKMTSSGAVLRLKGRGAPSASGQRGDQYVKLRIVLPEGGDAELEEFVKRWKGGDARADRKDKAEA